MFGIVEYVRLIRLSERVDVYALRHTTEAATNNGAIKYGMLCVHLLYEIRGLPLTIQFYFISLRKF